MSRSPVTAGMLADEDYQRLLEFRSQLREFLRWSEQAANEAGLTPSLHQLLLVVRGHPGAAGPTIRDAADALHIRHHSVVELTQRAQTAGLLTRERDEVDQRQVHLCLTDHGRAQLESLTRAHLPRISALSEVLQRVVRLQEDPVEDA